MGKGKKKQAQQEEGWIYKRKRGLYVRWGSVGISMFLALYGLRSLYISMRSDSWWKKTVEIAGRLAAVDDRYASWAEAVGVPVGSVTTQTEKDDLVAELDAVVSHLYGLDAEDLEVIWDTFHTTVDHLPSLDKVLAHHEDWAR